MNEQPPIRILWLVRVKERDDHPEKRGREGYHPADRDTTGRVSVCFVRRHLQPSFGTVSRMRAVYKAAGAGAGRRAEHPCAGVLTLRGPAPRSGYAAFSPAPTGSSAMACRVCAASR
jgi:hypothetical protein